MSAIFKREFKAYFTTPIGYIFLSVFYAYLGLMFWTFFKSGSPEAASLVAGTSVIDFFFIPILTMRLMCDDRRQKVDQALLTAPVKLISIVLGKFLAAFSVFAMAYIPTVIFELIFAANVSVNVMSYIYALIGALLLGGALVSIGMFVSCLTESTAISAILAIVVNIAVMLMPILSNLVSTSKYFSFLSKIFDKVDFISAAESFSTNIFKVADIIYFISIIAIFVFLSIRSLEKRRWS